MNKFRFLLIGVISFLTIISETLWQKFLAVSLCGVLGTVSACYLVSDNRVNAVNSTEVMEVDNVAQIYTFRQYKINSLSNNIEIIMFNNFKYQTIVQAVEECNQQQILTSSACAGDDIKPEEAKLYNLINQYRAQNRLAPIPLSKSLTLVANRHVRDIAKNPDYYRNCQGKYCAHGWSNCAYDADNSNTLPCMWDAPQKLNTGYPGRGYENLFTGSRNYRVTAEAALRGWQSSRGHNEVILNQGIWQNNQWNALGIGIYKGAAALWFGVEPDSGEKSPANTPNTSPQTDTQNTPNPINQPKEKPIQNQPSHTPNTLW
ncbi:CAP domain-containing protein [Anabaena catenula]|uniref:CAP domain-containing protein n=1 Tax=Anabaena catenula FACHB-362 TaxID=2692877 RepID=A0ABR8IZ60_9NOST|nr:CAP domain-containing protein [Anabaena catenula]MBD2691373.1 CAP domain-containing protein [Anabaena catenula FACHB-362]